MADQERLLSGEIQDHHVADLGPSKHASFDQIRHASQHKSKDDDDEYTSDIELPSPQGSISLDSLHQDATHIHTSPKAPNIAIMAVLALTVLGYAINTEATAYFEDTLQWKKPFATLYITHGSLCLPWLCHILLLRLKSRHQPLQVFIRDYLISIKSSITTIPAYTTSTSKTYPFQFLLTRTGLITLVLTLSGASWFFSLGLTTPADLTAIYNSATFFAAAFSVPLLKERLRPLGILAVALSLIGTFTIAYGDSSSTSPASSSPENSISTPGSVGTKRVLGNLIAIGGATAFGLYEVLFKKWACTSPSPTSTIVAFDHRHKGDSEQSKTLRLTLAASALTGFYTLGTLWIGLVVLHILQIEVFELPDLYTAMWIAIAVLSGSCASLLASFFQPLSYPGATPVSTLLGTLTFKCTVSITLQVLLVIWTDPVFGSMTNVLAVFAVVLADWLLWSLTPSLATCIGGGMIVVAFWMLARESL